ncbi:MAG: DUF2277 domain-containing protein, partial [Candidatus Dormibacteraceae bacterium]
MCRSIKPLRRGDQIAGEGEVREAALQFVRKVSGYRRPSAANEAAFLRAVDEISTASGRLLGELRPAGSRNHSSVSPTTLSSGGS